MIGNAIYSILAANSAVTTLAGSRITLSIIPQGQLVPCVYIGTDNVKPIPVRSPLGGFSGTVEVGFQASSYADLDALTKAVRGALDNYSGTIGDTTLNMNRGESTPDEYDEENRFHGRALTFSVSGGLS